jgi:uncharacterized Zn finger protein
MRRTSTCPVCSSSEIVEGRIIADGSEQGSAEKFFPTGLRLFKLKRSVGLTGRDKFTACTQCGHVWNTLDAGGLRDLIEAAGSDELKAKLALRKA